MKRKIVSVLTAALLTGALGSSAIFAQNETGVSAPTNPVVQATAKEVPNATIITDSTEPIVTPFGLILDGVPAVFPQGQGIVYFDFKALANGVTERVRVNVMNYGSKPLNYILIAPSGTSWMASTIAAGSQVTSEHIFGSGQAGGWKIKLDTNDGSAVNAVVNVRDGLTP